MKTILLIDGENFKNYVKYSLDKEKRDIIWNEYNFKGLFDLAQLQKFAISHSY